MTPLPAALPATHLAPFEDIIGRHVDAEVPDDLLQLVGGLLGVDSVAVSGGDHTGHAAVQLAAARQDHAPLVTRQRHTLVVVLAVLCGEGTG